MKHFTLLFLFLALSLSAQKKFDISIMSEGIMREAIISVPSTPPPAEGYPIVFMLHGTSGDKNVFYNSYGWKELGEKENFITVFPSALSWCFLDEGTTKHNTKFVCGDLLESVCDSEQDKLIDEIVFFKKLISIIKDTVSIDGDRIFASGFSNGCSMVNRIAMRGGDVFKAVGGSSAALNALDSLTPAHRIPNWLMVGTIDDRFLPPPYTEIPYGGDSVLAYLGAIIKRELACQGLTETYTKQESEGFKTYIFKECRNGEACQPFLFTLIEDHPHMYPNGRNSVVDAPKIFWEFFNKRISTSTHEFQQLPQSKILVYPNPANEQITIKWDEEILKPDLLNIYDARGALVYSNKNIGQEKLVVEKSEIGTGIFIAALFDGVKHKMMNRTFVME